MSSSVTCEIKKRLTTTTTTVLLCYYSSTLVVMTKTQRARKQTRHKHKLRRDRDRRRDRERDFGSHDPVLLVPAPMAIRHKQQPDVRPRETKNHLQPTTEKNKK